jgi:signal transduction histidine kinase
MTDVLILNIISNIAMCAFLYVQYREQCEQGRLTKLIILMFLMLNGTELLALYNVNKVIIVLLQAVIMLLVGLWALKKFSVLIFLNTFNGATFVLPGNIIGNLMLIYIPDAVSPFFKTFFAVMVCVAFQVLVLLAANMYIGNWMHSMARDPDFPWTLMFLIPIFYYIIIFWLMNNSANEAPSFRDLIIALLVTFLTISAYGLAIQILRYQKRNSDLYYSNAEYEMLIDQMSKRLYMTRESQREAAVLRHDQRHMVHILQQLIGDGKNEQALQVLSDYEKQVIAGGLKTYCKNVVINSVLEYAAAVCAEKKLEFDVQADLQEQLSVSELELAVILSNLLENAMQAAELCEDERKISFLAMNKGDKQIIEISNSFSEKLEYDPETHLPVSRRGEGHGFGMQSIQIFAEKNGAVFDCGEEDGRFVARLLLQGQA